MRELTMKETNEVNGGSVVATVVGVASAIGAVGAVGIVAAFSAGFAFGTLITS